MIIDNGRLVYLQITDVFDGEAGFARGRVAFVANQAGKKPEEARFGLVDGAPARLVVVAEGGVYTASVEALA